MPQRVLEADSRLLTEGIALHCPRLLEQAVFPSAHRLNFHAVIARARQTQENGCSGQAIIFNRGMEKLASILVSISASRFSSSVARNWELSFVRDTEKYDSEMKPMVRIPYNLFEELVVPQKQEKMFQIY